MDKYDILEKLGGVKVNLKNSMCDNVYFTIGMQQLTDLIEDLEKQDS